MEFLELLARAKINLSLDVVSKRSDGYHELKMIMQTIALHDIVTINKIDAAEIIVCSDSKWIPDGQDNIAYKAADLLVRKYDINRGVKINISKRIPIAAGLAGGSSNAAAVMKGMNALFSLGIGEAELMALGKQIGADVPYCIKGGTMLAEGIGEKLTPIKPLNGLNIVLVKPRIGVSTAWVYKNLNLKKISVRPDTQKLIQAIENENVEVLANNMVNVLETVTVTKYDIINRIKDKLKKLGAVGSMMSGSGPSVFGIFNDKNSAEAAYLEIKKDNYECFLTETVSEER